MEGNEDLNQLNGEEIILKVKPMYKYSEIVTFFVYIFMTLVISLLLGTFIILFPFIMIPMTIIIIVICCSLIYCGITIYDKGLRNKRSIIYFTKTRIINSLGEGFLSHKIKRVEFILNNIDHFIDFDNGIEIIMKSNKYNLPYYTGEETERKILYRTRELFIPLYGREGFKIMDDIEDILIRFIPANPHPNLDRVFISTSFK